jgi:hypothetical protein
MIHIFISHDPAHVKRGATGHALPGYTATVLDADGNRCAPGEIGRLAVKGPTGCRYLADERQKDYVQNGWNVTGDAYVLDMDGYFHYQARTDDMIISAGYNIAGPGSRGRAAVASRGRRVRRGRLAGRGARHDRQGVRRREAGQAKGEALAVELQEHCEAQYRAVQVSARDRVRRRAAAHGDGKAAALQAEARNDRPGSPAMMQILQPPEWARPKGLLQRNLGERRNHRLHRRAGRLDRRPAIRGENRSAGNSGRRSRTSSRCWRRPAGGPSTWCG